MKKIDDSYTKEIIFHIFSGLLLSTLFIIFGILCTRVRVRLIDYSKWVEYQVLAFIFFTIGIYLLVIFTKLVIKKIIRKNQIRRALQNGTLIKAKIERKKGLYLVCSVEINGIRQEFLSETVHCYALYACQELGITELPMYINMQKPEEYVIDTSEIEDRIVDLT